MDGPWVGVDVGGAAKGFDVAVLRGRRVAELHDRCAVADVVALVRRLRPPIVAIDSPCSAAPPGRTLREGEREVRRAVCGIRWTPAADRIEGNPYYGWVVEGFALYAALAEIGVETVECFPTASWTRWAGPRGAHRRSAWTTVALAALALEGVPARTNQDQRDAIAAALTAEASVRGRCDRYGEIVVPREVPPTGIEPVLTP